MKTRILLFELTLAVSLLLCLVPKFSYASPQNSCSRSKRNTVPKLVGLECHCGKHIEGSLTPVASDPGDPFSSRCVMKNNLTSICVTDGACRKTLFRHNEQLVTVTLDCVDHHLMDGPVEVDVDPTGRPLACLADVWWKSARGCCNTGSLCNVNIELQIGNVFSSPLWLAENKIPGMFPFVGSRHSSVQWTHPCRTAKDCYAPYGKETHCISHTVNKGLTVFANVCCAALPGESAGGLLGGSCCGDDMICKIYEDDCICARKGTLDGTACSLHKAGDRPCFYEPLLEKNVYCTVMELNKTCHALARCCSGMVCLEGKCARMPDGSVCYNHTQCVGGFCAIKTTKVASASAVSVCCSKQLGDRCSPCADSNVQINNQRGAGLSRSTLPSGQQCDQCCGGLVCRDGTCQCSVQTIWSDWEIPTSEVMFEACTNVTKLKRRYHAVPDYCGATEEWSDLTKAGSTFNCPNKCRVASMGTHLVEGRGLVYLGCYFSENRFLSKIVNQKPMTPLRCFNHCKSFGTVYNISGVFSESYCGCTNKIYSYIWGPVVQDESKCNLKCSLYPEYTCGGTSAASLYYDPDYLQPEYVAQIKCFCGLFLIVSKVKGKLSTFGLSQCSRTDDSNAFCITDGLCRKRLKKVSNTTELAIFECVDERKLMVDDADMFSPVCTTESWWESAVACCRDKEFCNSNLSPTVGGLDANPLFMKPDLYLRYGKICVHGMPNVTIVMPSPIIVQPPHMKSDKESFIQWGFPCTDVSQCATTFGHKPYCYPRWISDLEQHVNVCCAAFPGQTKTRLTEAGCCGSGMVCTKSNCTVSGTAKSACKCVSNGPIDGTVCQNDNDCSNRPCHYDPMLRAKVCCSITLMGQPCNLTARIRCCDGMLCRNSICVKLPDGGICIHGSQCLGGKCDTKKFNQIVNGANRCRSADFCCSKTVGESCQPCGNATAWLYDDIPLVQPLPVIPAGLKCDQCCGDLKCTDRICKKTGP